MNPDPTPALMKRCSFSLYHVILFSEFPPLCLNQGWLGFSSTGGAWVIHSVPAWNQATDLPSHKYAQSFLCVTLTSAESVNTVLQALVDVNANIIAGCSVASTANPVAAVACLNKGARSPRDVRFTLLCFEFSNLDS